MDSSFLRMFEAACLVVFGISLMLTVPVVYEAYFGKLFNFFAKRSRKKALLRESRAIADEIEKIDFSQLSDNKLSELSVALKRKVKDAYNANEMIYKADLINAFAIATEALKRVFDIKCSQYQIFFAVAVLKNDLFLNNEHSLLEFDNVYNECDKVDPYLILSTYITAMISKVRLPFNMQSKRADIDKVFKFLEMSTGHVLHSMSEDVRRQQYKCDIIYSSDVAAKFIESEMRYIDKLE